RVRLRERADGWTEARIEPPQRLEDAGRAGVTLPDDLPADRQRDRESRSEGVAAEACRGLRRRGGRRRREREEQGQDRDKAAHAPRAYAKSAASSSRS